MLLKNQDANAIVSGWSEVITPVLNDPNPKSSNSSESVSSMSIKEQAKQDNPVREAKLLDSKLSVDPAVRERNKESDE
jgi:hypothetical protein